MTIEYYHTIIDYLRKLFEGTRWEGHVYAVGGCCRDEVLGCEIKDIDLAVDLPGGGIALAEWLYDKGLTTKEPVTFPTFGTAMLRLKHFPDDEIEIVQTRQEKYTDRTRRDPTIAFGPKEEDCGRRDLTINALYYDISAGKMLDILGCSISDIENKIIRTPADPDSTFDDDPVRILRAIRLAARYGWDIEENTLAGIVRNAPRLEIVRKERMQAEVEKMLTGPAPARAMALLADTGCMPYVIPELVPLMGLEQNYHHDQDSWNHTLKVLSLTPPIGVVRMAALLHDIGKPMCRTVDSRGTVHYHNHERRCKHLINNALRRLRYDSSYINKVIFLVSNSMATKSWGPDAEKMTDAALRRLQLKCSSRERFRRLMYLINADNQAYAPGYCMPNQVEAIMKRSDELSSEGLALFTCRQPFTHQKIRKIKGLDGEISIEPYLDFLVERLIDNPAQTRKNLEKLLRSYTPGRTSRRHRRSR